MKHTKLPAIADTAVIPASKRLVIGMLLSFLLLGVFVMIAWHYPRLAIVDRTISEYVRHFSSAGMTTLMKWITYSGSAAVTIAIAIVALLYTHYRKPRYLVEAYILSICLSGAWVSNEALKALFRRTRPEVAALVLAEGYSFPSGHAMTSFAFYGLLGYLLWQYGKRRGSLVGRLCAFGAWLLALTIGISRVYLGVHFPSDVLAGYAAGGVWLVGCVTALHITKARTRKLDA